MLFFCRGKKRPFHLHVKHKNERALTKIQISLKIYLIL
jgi:hypothetical protein